MRITTLILGVFCTFLVYSDVNISVNHQTYSYSGNPRLLDVLSPIAESDTFYWPVAALYRLNSNKVEQKRLDILSKLEVLRAEHKAHAWQDALKALENQIISWELAERVFIEIDIDKVRVQDKHNPLFENGDYLMVLKTRPKVVSVFGMQVKPQLLPLLPSSSAYDYMKNISIGSGHDKSFVFLIQGDGSISKSGIAYWNRSDIQVMPGGTLYVPIAEGLFSSRIGKLNKQIAQLAANRVVR